MPSPRAPMPFPARAARTLLRRALREAAVPRAPADETLALLETLTDVRADRHGVEEDPARDVWEPFLLEVVDPSPPGAAPRCFLAARLLATLEDPDRLSGTLRRHVPAALLGVLPPERAPLPLAEDPRDDPFFGDIPF
jgi:hypothetical protein